MSLKGKNKPEYGPVRRSLSRGLSAFIATVILVCGTGLLAQQPESEQIQAAASAPLPCIPGPAGPETAEQQLCLNGHIPGFGGYSFVGPCEVIVYLTDLGEVGAADNLLQRYVAANLPKCGSKLLLEIRKAKYSFADLYRWGGQARKLLLHDEETKIPDAGDVLGMFIVDNRVSFYLDPESLTDTKAIIAKANQVLRAHGFDPGAFRFSKDLFSSSLVSRNLLGISDPCVPLNSALSVCMNLQDVEVSLVDATPMSVLGSAKLRSRVDLFYVFQIAWDSSPSLEEYAEAQLQDLAAGSTLSNPVAVKVQGYPAIRYDLEPASAAGSSNLPPIKMILFVDTGAGLATIIGIPKKPDVSSEDLYVGAESVVRILQIRKK